MLAGEVQQLCEAKHKKEMRERSQRREELRLHFPHARRKEE